MDEDIELHEYEIELQRFGETPVFLGKYLAESYEEARNKARWEWSSEFAKVRWEIDLKIKQRKRVDNHRTLLCN